MTIFISRAQAAACALAATLVASPACAGGYIIEQAGKGFSFNTATGLATQNGVSMRGLNSVARKGEFELRAFWEKGAFRPTVMFGNNVIVDGKDINDVSRIGGFRFDRIGDFVYIRTTKGPKAKVELVLNGVATLEWPRLAVVRILTFRRNELIVSVFDKRAQQTRFYRHIRNGIRIEQEGTLLGSYAGCTLLGTKPARRSIILQAYCDPERGSDLLKLDTQTGAVAPLLATEADETLAPRLLRGKRGVPALEISGTPAAKMAFHAISGVFLRGLGEPVSLASDEAGKQSWTQSYRTLTLATLYRKTGHRVFADLATLAMRSTLSVRNKDLGIGGKFNPPAAWASRIYSTDRRSPVSFQINQAMISGALLQSCERLGERCTTGMKQKIMRNARRLINSYERYYEKTSGLYRIQYGAPFRFDGIWAPWNWHLTWAVVLDRVGSADNHPELSGRASLIADAFTQIWSTGPKGALWRYWVPNYYRGWQKADRISVHRPARKPEPMPKRFEDINHAGLSLMGLGAIKHNLHPEQKRGLQTTLDRLLSTGAILPRDLDGKGPRAPRWMPGAGWDAFATEKMRARYAKLIPGASSGHQLLAYANLFDPAAPFQLTFKLRNCSENGCPLTKSWTFDSLNSFLTGNPIFTIKPVSGS